MSDISPIDTERIALLQLANQYYERDNQISSVKIQRAPVYLRQKLDVAKYCTPKMISFGPIHHGDRDLEQGEHYKLLWAYHYIEEYSKQDNQVITDQEALAHSLLTTVEDNIGELKKLFTEDVIGTKTDKDLAWMLFVDGCSLLHFMAKIDIHHPEALKLKYIEMMYIWRDIILLENQLPWRLLEMLGKDGSDLGYLMMNFRSRGNLRLSGLEVPPENKVKKREANLEQPTTNSDHMGDKTRSIELKLLLSILSKCKPVHLLDYLRSFYTSTSIYFDEENEKDVEKQRDGDEHKRVAPPENLHFQPTYKNIRDLKAAGIRGKPNAKFGMIWTRVSFTSNLLSGELSLPMLMFDNLTPYIYCNLVAYEMCPDFHNNLECCLFFCFLDSLIDGGDDVKELRLAGCIQNRLGSDDELAQVINSLVRELPADLMTYNNYYTKSRYQIEKHYTSWRAIVPKAISMYFSDSMALFTFLTAVATITFTCIQTWYSVNPKKP